MASIPENERSNRVPKYKTPEALKEKCDAYFEWCDGTLLKDDDGHPVLTKFGEPVYIDRHPPTMTGLARFLGFKSRQSLKNCRMRGKAFNEVIMDARMRIETFCEEQLFTRDGVNGAKFSLAANFNGWKEEKTEGSAGPTVTIINDIPKPEAPIQQGTVEPTPEGAAVASGATEKAEEVKSDG